MTRSSHRWIKVGGLGSSLALISLACLQTSTLADTKKTPAAPATFVGDVKPVLDKFCIKCHSGAQAAAGLNLAQFNTPDTVLSDTATWSKIIDRVGSATMPPDGVPQPTGIQRKRIVDWVGGALKNQCKLADPGRVTIRRLNRVEYDNTVKDLTGLAVHASEDFPSDDVGYGFDDIGDVLSLSPLLMEKYLSAAEKIAKQVVIIPDPKPKHFEVSDMSIPSGSNVVDNGFLKFSSEGKATKTINIPIGGAFKLKSFAYGDQAGPEAPKLVVTVDDKPVTTFNVDVRKNQANLYQAPVDITAGKHNIGVAFTNDYYNVKDPKGHQDRNLYVKFVELEGPADNRAPVTPAYTRLIPTQPTSPEQVQPDARKYIHTFADRAYRRPVSTEELDRLMKLFNAGLKGGSFDSGMQLAMEGVLVSPNFLFRIELDPKSAATQVRPLNDYELASRLSYFLWSSMPDDELLDLAAKGKLHQDAELSHQVKRMLADPRAQALADNFAGQWLQLRKLAIIEPNPKQFPGIDDTMKGYMATETKMFFNSVLDNNRPIADFIDSNYSFINEPLAKVYGIEGITGNEFRKVAMSEPRGGVLTQASILTVTSNPTRTSPTKRGKWVLEQILGTPPPPPPPGVSVISDEQTKLTATTIRKLMEEHRKNPMCAACHAKMDPIGFGFENFDAVGRWRTKDGPADLDTTGTLPGGGPFKGATDLKQILLKNKAEFARALAEKLLTYGLGRGIESADKCAVDAIIKKAATNDYRFESLLISVVESDPFRKRKGEVIKS